VRTAPSLAQQTTLWLACAFVVIEVLLVTLFVIFVLLPLARRSADDLAALMVLSAQTWAELPPQTRPAFEEELLNSHALALRPASSATGPDEWHPLYFYVLEEALARRTGVAQHLVSEMTDGNTWFWCNVPTGIGPLGVGLAKSRIESQPFVALVTGLVAGLFFVIALAYWLARRITQPLARLEAASALIGQGATPRLLPETGPRELASLSRRFNAMARQVSDLLSARTTLLAGVSHDLRTPLARMRLALEMLKTDPTPQLIERLERDIAQMNQLIGNVLDLARGLEHEKPVHVDWGHFLTQIATDFSTPDHAVEVRFPAGTWLVARSALQRAIGNLLQNAQRYAPHAPVELVCEVEGLKCRIGVLDRGPGIAADKIESMFAPFQRMEASRSPATGGSGLGLAIVRELARANAWDVTLSARPGGGLQAWIAL
jgi:two-component system osmolarity sensor histidine kinase EnvZ